jgi:two-component system CheB/CheR fusion protein
LEALEALFGKVTRECPLSFVVVQHLDPTRKGLLVELLRRATTLPVEEIADGDEVKAGHVHVIPPNRDLKIEGGILRLEEPLEPRGSRMAVDHFLRSLAADRGARSMGVILSGMGSDGVLGLRAIKEAAGACFVQDPTTAKCESMPRSAIEAGLADIVAAPERLVSEIESYLGRMHGRVLGDVDAPETSERGQLDKVLALLRARTGHDFSQYKKSTLYRRIERRLCLHQLKGIAEYVGFLRSNPGELDLLFKELLIGVTSFFRDPAVWDRLNRSAAAYRDVDLS